MAKLHVIYDPRDLITHKPEWDKKFGIKQASLSISDNLSNDEIEEYGKQLMAMLLENIRIDEPE